MIEFSSRVRLFADFVHHFIALTTVTLLVASAVLFGVFWFFSLHRVGVRLSSQGVAFTSKFVYLSLASFRFIADPLQRSFPSSLKTVSTSRSTLDVIDGPVVAEFLNRLLLLLPLYTEQGVDELENKRRLGYRSIHVWTQYRPPCVGLVNVDQNRRDHASARCPAGLWRPTCNRRTARLL